MKPPVHPTFAELYKTHAASLRLYARQWVDAAGAEDVVQEVFLRFVSRGRQKTDARTWLFRCVRNGAINARRSAERRGRRERAATASDWFVPAADEAMDARAAQDALAGLEPVQREVVTLRIWSGLTLAEIAQVTGLAVSSVHDQYRQGLGNMRKQLEKNGTNQIRSTRP